MAFSPSSLRCDGDTHPGYSQGLSRDSNAASEERYRSRCKAARCLKRHRVRYKLLLLLSSCFDDPAWDCTLKNTENLCTENQISTGCSIRTDARYASPSAHACALIAKCWWQKTRQQAEQVKGRKSCWRQPGLEHGFAPNSDIHKLLILRCGLAVLCMARRGFKCNSWDVSLFLGRSIFYFLKAS